jgi:hypothetical protein
MAESEKSSDAPCVTPLYHFSSDSSRLDIDKGISIRQFGDYPTSLFDEEMQKNLGMREPDYLLWQDVFLPRDAPHLFSPSDIGRISTQKEWQEFLVLVLEPVREWLRVLRLFNPGRLHAGETFVLARRHDGERYETCLSGRASDMTVDYFVLRSETKNYTLSSTEISSLRMFRKSLLPFLRKINSFPSVELALLLYGSDDGTQSDFMGAFTALEALLTKDGETEGLTYRLSMRIANLLGNDTDARKARFQDVRKLYNLRSKMVHGSPLPAKHRDPVGELDSLRETLRRVLLSVMALLSEGVRRDELPDLLDDLAFDDKKRKQVQATASKFLHINVQKVGT